MQMPHGRAKNGIAGLRPPPPRPTLGRNDQPLPMPSYRFASLAGLLAITSIAHFVTAQPAGFNYDEAKVPAYTLPPLLNFQDGRPVRAADWPARRAELLALVATEAYGRMPAPGVATVRRTVLESSDQALGGLAKRRQLRVDVTAAGKTASFQLLVYTPAAAKGPVPCFLGLNFTGNHSINRDPAILLPTSWMANNKENGVTANRATEAGRGKNDRRWEVEAVLQRGYGTATAFYGDIHPDRPDGGNEGLGVLMRALSASLPEAERPGAIATWAWGLQRALDALEQEPLVDARRVAVHGHSRLGKASIWAGVTDERFAVVISNDSGAGGAALHKRIFGETIARLNKNFPHWFAPRFRHYDDKEALLPFDQHQVLALVAPRPLYVASATEDLWADPHGEFLALQAAEPAWLLLGQKGLGGAIEPPADTPVGDRLGYHRRTGKHDIVRYDWERYLDFADRWLKTK